MFIRLANSVLSQSCRKLSKASPIYQSSSAGPFSTVSKCFPGFLRSTNSTTSTINVQLRCCSVGKPATSQKRQNANTKIPIGGNVLTIPNLLTLSRVCVTPWLGYLVVQESFHAASIVFVLASISDVADGWIARAFPSQESALGSTMDPLADKLLVGTLYFSLCYVGLIPVPLTCLIIARDACLIASVFYLRHVTLDPPKTFRRFFDISSPTTTLKPTLISKVNTAVQLGLVATTLAAPIFNFTDHYILPCLWAVTATTTVVSGLSYVFSKNTYEVLKKQSKR